MGRADAVKKGLDYYYDHEVALHAVNYFADCLTHSKGQFAGKPFILEPWEQFATEELFGWRRVTDGLRRYRVAYVSTPKKNGKSTWLAGTGLYLLTADDEAAAHVFGAAFDREQGGIVFTEAAEMVRHSPLLNEELEVIDSRKTIAFRATSSFYKVLTADAARVEGLSIHGLLFDELHTQRRRFLWDSLRYGGASRSQPLIIATTTAGFTRNSICWEQYQYAKRVMRDWQFDPTFFPLIFEADEKDDWKDPAVWRKANPSWGITFDTTAFEAEFREAQSAPSKESSFRRYRLNQWTKQETKWLPPDVWERAGKPPPFALLGRECFCGLDLASTRDTCAFVAVFPHEDGTYDVVSHFWIPSENAVERERNDGVEYRRWADQKFLTMTDGNQTDYQFIRRWINQFAEQHVVRELGIDIQFNGAQMATQLQDDGLNVSAIRTSFATMNSPSQFLESTLVSGKLRHSGNEVLTNHANNVSIKVNADGAIRPVKTERGSPNRIDGIAALVQAFAVYLTHKPPEPEPTPSLLFL